MKNGALDSLQDYPVYCSVEYFVALLVLHPGLRVKSPVLLVVGRGSLQDVQYLDQSLPVLHIILIFQQSPDDIYE